MTYRPDGPQSIRGRIAAILSPELVALVMVVVLAVAVVVILSLASPGSGDSGHTAPAGLLAQVASGWP